MAFLFFLFLINYKRHALLRLIAICGLYCGTGLLFRWAYFAGVGMWWQTLRALAPRPSFEGPCFGDILLRGGGLGSKIFPLGSQNRRHVCGARGMF
jgi:hypothetical protein